MFIENTIFNGPRRIGKTTYIIDLISDTLKKKNTGHKLDIYVITPFRSTDIYDALIKKALEWREGFKLEALPKHSAVIKFSNKTTIHFISPDRLPSTEGVSPLSSTIFIVDEVLLVERKRYKELEGVVLKTPNSRLVLTMSGTAFHLANIITDFKNIAFNQIIQKTYTLEVQNQFKDQFLNYPTKAFEEEITLGYKHSSHKVDRLYNE